MVYEKLYTHVMSTGIDFFEWMKQLDENARRLIMRKGIEKSGPETVQSPTPEDVSQGDLVRFSLDSGQGMAALVADIKGKTTVRALDIISQRPIEFDLRLMRQQPDSLLSSDERRIRDRSGGNRFWHAYASESQMKRHERGDTKAKRDIEAWLRSAGHQNPSDIPQSSALDDLLSGKGGPESGEEPEFPWAA